MSNVNDSSTIAQCLAQSASLAAVSDTARLDVEVLLAHALGKNRTYLYTWPETLLSQQEVVQFQHDLLRRQQGEPIAYIVGEKDFWSLTLFVNASTLIPRPETELLVEVALELLNDNDGATVVDVGTGTGAIALALASEKPRWTITAIDNQVEACTLAERNRQRYQLANVSIRHGSWLIPIQGNKVDLIVSNPPYIDIDDGHLACGDVRFEPRSALVADEHGLADIQQIIQQSTAILLPKGWLLFEHGYQQGEAVQELLQASHFRDCFTRYDVAGQPRVTGGQWLGPVGVPSDATA